MLKAKQPLHPLKENEHHTYPQMCKKICNWYGVKDAEAWFSSEVRRIKDKCLPDPYRLSQSDSFAEYWSIRQKLYKWVEDNHEKDVTVNNTMPYEGSKPHCVEIYAVRGAGANGELGVLTTTHETEEFINGLATAVAQYVSKHKTPTQQQLEHDLRWIFKNAFPVAYKLSGYKADEVIERHVLMCGSNAPAADDIVASA